MSRYDWVYLSGKSVKENSVWYYFRITFILFVIMFFERCKQLDTVTAIKLKLQELEYKLLYVDSKELL